RRFRPRLGYVSVARSSTSIRIDIYWLGGLVERVRPAAVCPAGWASAALAAAGRAGAQGPSGAGTGRVGGSAAGLGLLSPRKAPGWRSGAGAAEHFRRPRRLLPPGSGVLR